MNATARAALATIVVLGVAVVVAPMFASTDARAIGDVLATRLVPPLARDSQGAFHLLGTDRFGRDLFVRMMLAGRLSLAIGVGGSLIAGLLGIAVGSVSAWIGGAVDRTTMAISDALLAIPRLILLLLCAALWTPGTTTVIAILVATGWMGVARLVRAEVLGARQLAYVDAARALGAPSARILWRHLLPNALGPAIVAITLGVGNAILLESGLAFLGLGVQPPDPSWGNMIAGGRELIVIAPWVAIAPGVALIVTVLSCTLLGDALRDRIAGDGARTIGERA